ncbi:MAG: hypothetical protein V7605_2679 [Acidimicrobiaceae bacterium]
MTEGIEAVGDRAEIAELVSRHGHLIDAGRLDELDSVFTADVVYDVSAYGFGALEGIPAIRDAALALGDGNPVGHHVTNVIVSVTDADSAAVVSKGLGVMADGTCGSVVYEDIVRREPAGWRISYRKVVPRHRPLGRLPDP